MTREEFIDVLTVAGNKFDGHVTNGSIQEQMKVIEDILGPYSFPIIPQYHPSWDNKK